MGSGNQYQKIVPFILFVLILFLLFKLIQPVITIILTSVLLAYIAFPVYKRIRKKTSKKSLSIFLSLIFVVIIILIPFAVLVVGVGQQGYYFYNSLTDTVAKGAILGLACDSETSKVCFLINQAEKFSLEQLSKFGIDKQFQIYLPMLEDKIKQIILSIPLIMAKIFITLVITYFVIKDHEAIIKKISDMLPIRKNTKQRLIKEFGNIAHTVIYAQLFIALVQGTIGGLGFYLFGAPFPILSGVLIAFFALVPFIGTAIIWFPASLYLILSGYFSQDYWVLAKGIGLLLYGFLIIGTIDNIMLAKIVKAKANVSPILIIIGVIGGVTMFGVIGLFIGPILLPLLITYIETFKDRFT